MDAILSNFPSRAEGAKSGGEIDRPTREEAEAAERELADG